MILQIKSLSGGLQEDQKKYIRKKFLWLEDHLPNSAVLTVGVREHVTKKSNQAYEVLLHLDTPGTKKPYYVRTYANGFTQAVDPAKDRIERMVLRLKERKGFKLKIPVPSFKFLKRKNEKSV
jgi:ribosome-associated translation inhibitor RaiA